MLSVLINAYACGPNRGSEPGMAWNWCCHLAKHCKLHIFTEGEFRDEIEEALSSLEQGKNMHFYYFPVSDKVRRMWRNQGDWRFYYYYAKWQKQVAKAAGALFNEHRIDILHHLNMTGFREPGYLAQLSKETGIPLVWGPIGGLKKFPMAYANGIKMKAFNWLKNTITDWQISHDKRVRETLHQSSLLISSIPDSCNAIKRSHGLESVIIPETGCLVEETDNLQHLSYTSHEKDSNNLTLIWVGKFDFRKRLDIALKAVAACGIENLVLKIFGSGNETQVANARQLSEQLGIKDKVQFMGNQPNGIVKEEMRRSDAFLFTSVNEDTSTVVLEAISNHLPVICFDCCGMAAVIDETVGIKIPLTNPNQSVKDFAKAIDRLYNYRSLLSTLSANCHKRALELSWERKAEKMVELYNRTIIK